MKSYLDLVRSILDTGSWQDNRTGIRTISMPGAMLRFDLAEGFPAITTRRLAFKAAMGELVGFLRGATSAAEFRDLGCKVWDQNANENAQWLANPWRLGDDDLGPVYGAQWRAWPGWETVHDDAPKAAERVARMVAGGWRQAGRVDLDGRPATLLHKPIDQLRACLDTIERDPTSRRILFHGWNPAALDRIALPACHLLYQFLPNPGRREISLCLYVRSNDVGLGTPFFWHIRKLSSKAISRIIKPKNVFFGRQYLQEQYA